MLSQVTEFLSLLGLTNLPSPVHTFSLSSVNKHLDCYQALATGHKLQSTGCRRLLSGVLWTQTPWRDCWVVWWLWFWLLAAAPHCSPRRLHRLHSHPLCTWSPFLHGLPHLLSRHFDHSRADRCGVGSHLWFGPVSLPTSDEEHLSRTCRRFVSLSSPVLRPLQVLCISDISALADMWFANTLSHSAFQVGDGLLRCEGAVSLREPRLSVFALGACASRVTSPKTAKTPVQELPACVFF